MTRWACAAALLMGLACAGGVSAAGSVYGEIRWRSDDIEDLPGGREFERLRLFGFLGWQGQGERLEWGAAIRLAAGTDSNADNVRNLDNEESDELDLGELWLRLPLGASSRLQVGQAPMPLWLTPMLWDLDLRPAGFSIRHERPLREYDALVIHGAYLAPHHIDEYEARLAAVQLDWRILEGAQHSGSVTLSYLDFDDLEGLVGDRRTRTNRVGNGRLVSDFELLDLTAQYRFPLWGRPALLSLDLVKNLGAADQDEGARFGFRVGNAWLRGQWELGYAYQRIQRDAVMAAFNSDDWWFPTWMRGWSPSVGYGLRDDLRLRIAGFIERRDDRSEHAKRLLVDLTWLF